jgi:hypothetical protein
MITKIENKIEAIAFLIIIISYIKPIDSVNNINEAPANFKSFFNLNFKFWLLQLKLMVSILR